VSGTSDSRSDGELARRIAAAPPGAASPEESELCRRYHRRLRAYGLRHLGAGSADDLAQRVLLLALEKLRNGAVDDPDRIGSFLLGCARMIAHELRRAATRLAPLADQDAQRVAQPPSVADPLASAQLARCLQSLVDRERTVVVLSYYAEAASTTIAESLGVEAGNVRVIRHRAIMRLRDCMHARAEARA
jgi:RNA polymerase sigma-70 factor (ECF subfamily)